MTGLSDLAYPPDSMSKWGEDTINSPFTPGGNGYPLPKPNDNVDEEKLTNRATEWAFTCQRYMGPWTAAVFSVAAFLSPILMVLIPQLGLMSFRESQLRCHVECDGLLISFAFRLLVLLIGSWAVFFRPSKATLPRIFLYRSAICVLIFIFSFSFWLFYAVRIGGEQQRRVQYYDVVQYASSMVDALLFVHYLAVLLIELRHLTPQ